MRYNEVIIEKGDSQIIASDGVKKRITANELVYECQCKKVEAPFCKLEN